MKRRCYKTCYRKTSLPLSLSLSDVKNDSFSIKRLSLGLSLRKQQEVIEVNNETGKI